jgi:hypothetical protein
VTGGERLSTDLGLGLGQVVPSAEKEHVPSVGPFGYAKAADEHRNRLVVNGPDDRHTEPLGGSAAQ